MSDAVWISIVGGVVSLASLLMTLLIKKNQDVLKTQIDGHMSNLLEKTAIAEAAKGKEAGNIEGEAKGKELGMLEGDAKGRSDLKQEQKADAKETESADKIKDLEQEKKMNETSKAIEENTKKTAENTEKTKE